MVGVSIQYDLALARGLSLTLLKPDIRGQRTLQSLQFHHLSRWYLHQGPDLRSRIPTRRLLTLRFLGHRFLSH